MVKRYYYDCPLEAAYMAKNFGMKFHSPANDEYAEEIYLDPQDILNADTCGDYKDSIFIYPDSLPLLEPKVGDIVEYDINCFSRNECPQNKDYALVKVGTGILKQLGRRLCICVSSAPGVGPGVWGTMEAFIKIIQRDGKPFFWPKEASDA